MVKKSIKSETIINDYEKKSRVKLTVSPETKDLVMNCIPIFLKYHPEMEGMNITENFIVKQIALYYERGP